MLSFLQEQEAEDLSGRETLKQPSGKRAEPQTAKPTNCPAAEAQGQEYLTVAVQDRNVRKTTRLFAVLFGIGLLCLWFMIKKSTPPTATAAGTEETRIEIAIARLTGVRSEMFSGLEKIVNKFYEFSDVQQVNTNELVKNPFEFEIFMGNAKEISDIEEGNEMLRQQTQNLELLSIMRADQGQGHRANCCMIEDKILYEGDSIRGFKVSKIADSFVKLQNTDLEIVLRLSE